MGENNIVEVAAEQATEAVVNTATSVPAVDTGLDTGHKVLFYVLLGLISVTVIGVPVAIILWRRSAKKCKQLEEELNKLKNPTPEAEKPADATTTETKEEPKAEEKPADDKKKK